MPLMKARGGDVQFFDTVEEGNQRGYIVTTDNFSLPKYENLPESQTPLTSKEQELFRSEEIKEERQATAQILTDLWRAGMALTESEVEFLSTEFFGDEWDYIPGDDEDPWTIEDWGAWFDTQSNTEELDEWFARGDSPTPAAEVQMVLEFLSGGALLKLVRIGTKGIAKALENYVMGRAVAAAASGEVSLADDTMRAILARNVDDLGEGAIDDLLAAIDNFGGTVPVGDDAQRLVQQAIANESAGLSDEFVKLQRQAEKWLNRDPNATTPAHLINQTPGTPRTLAEVLEEGIPRRLNNIPDEALFGGRIVQGLDDEALGITRQTMSDFFAREIDEAISIRVATQEAIEVVTRTTPQPSLTGAARRFASGGDEVVAAGAKVTDEAVEAGIKSVADDITGAGKTVVDEAADAAKSVSDEILATTVDDVAAAAAKVTEEGTQQTTSGIQRILRNKKGKIRKTVIIAGAGVGVAIGGRLANLDERGPDGARAPQQGFGSVEVDAMDDGSAEQQGGDYVMIERATGNPIAEFTRDELGQFNASDTELPGAAGTPNFSAELSNDLSSYSIGVSPTIAQGGQYGQFGIDPNNFGTVRIGDTNPGAAFDELGIQGINQRGGPVRGTPEQLLSVGGNRINAQGEVDDAFISRAGRQSGPLSEQQRQFIDPIPGTEAKEGLSIRAPSDFGLGVSNIALRRHLEEATGSPIATQDYNLRVGAEINPAVFNVAPNNLSYLQIIAGVSEKFKVPIGLLYGQLNQESGFQPDAVGNNGQTLGIAQLNLDTHTRAQALDPVFSISEIAENLRRGFDQYGSWEAAVLVSRDEEAATQFAESGQLGAVDSQYIKNIVGYAQRTALGNTIFNLEAVESATSRGSGGGVSAPAFIAPDPATLREFATQAFNQALGRDPDEEDLTHAVETLTEGARQAHAVAVKRSRGVSAVDVDFQQQFVEELEKSGEGQFRTSARERSSMGSWMANVGQLLRQS